MDAAVVDEDEVLVVVGVAGVLVVVVVEAPDADVVDRVVDVAPASTVVTVVVVEVESDGLTLPEVVEVETSMVVVDDDKVVLFSTTS